MTRRLRNWTYRDVTDFLREHEFSFFEELDGSHERWIKRGEDDEPDRLVEVSFSKKSCKTKALQATIRPSGIDQDE
jgi:hypothetical protein